MDKYILKYVQESEIFSFGKLKADLSELSNREIDDTELLNILALLKNKHVVVQYRSEEEKLSYKDDFDYDGLNYDELDFSQIDPSKEQYFVFRYVGIIIVNRYVFKCFPKYIQKSSFNKDRIDKCLKEIIDVLKKYNSRQERLFADTYSNSDNDFDLLSMAIFFLNDYLENGIYFNQKSIMEINGEGNINWAQTIDQIDAIITDRGPVYVEFYTEAEEEDDNDYFKRLHLYIISCCANLLESADLFDVLSLEGNFDFEIDKDSLGDDNYILEKIQKEINVQFVTRKLGLLEKMYTFIAQRNSIDKEYELSIYGTSHFHTVWEDVCKDVLNNQLDQELRYLPCQSKLDYFKLANIRYKWAKDSDKRIRAVRRLKETRLDKLIEKPVWHVSGSIQTYEGDKTYIPDLLQLYMEDDILHFNILDAKYRTFMLDNQCLKNAPGVEEITKQYLYQLVFLDLIDSYKVEKQNIKITNSLLFPGDFDTMRNLGSVEIKVMHNIPLENINAVRIPASKIYKLYISNHKIRCLQEIP